MDTPLHALAVPDADPRDAEAPGGRRRRDHRRRCAPRLPARAARRARRRAHDRRRPSRSRGRARLLIARAPTAASGTCRAPRSRTLFRPGDLVVANDAATLPASLSGTHLRERQADRGPARRLAVARAIRPASSRIAFGAGDHRTPHGGPAAPAAAVAGRPPRARAARRRWSSALLGHPRLIELRFLGSGADDAGRAGAARPADPVRARRASRWRSWDVWTPIAANPVAFEAPSAGFALDWRTLAALAAARHRLRHAHPCRRHLLDRRSRARPPAAVRRALPHPAGDRGRDRRDQAPNGGRVIAIGTTVVRALEAAAVADAAVRAGDGVARGRIGPDTPLARRRRHPHRRPPAGRKPFRAAARLRRRRGIRPRRTDARPPRLPHPRIRGFAARRAGASPTRGCIRRRRRGIYNALTAPCERLT